MAQISRPFQIALAAVALFALLWVVALHRPSSGSSSSAGHAAAPATSQGGSAPGVEGLTKAIAKAHGAVATSQQNAKQLQEKAAQASSNETSSASARAQHSATAAKPGAGTHAATRASSHAAAPPRTARRTAPQSPAKAFARQHAVEAALAHGKTVAVLFWSSKGSDDVVVRNALRALAGHDRGLAVQLASASQVASFGTITRGVQVNGTPTLLLVGAHGHTRVLTGLQDGYAIEQAVSQLRHP
jgi:hypothetical protein